MVRELLKRGASVDLQGSHGSTALMDAAYYGHQQVCKLLRRHQLWRTDGLEKERFVRMFEEAFTRPPESHETSILMDSLPALMELHGGDQNSPGLWQDLCHSLFSMNDFIYLP